MAEKLSDIGKKLVEKPPNLAPAGTYSDSHQGICKPNCSVCGGSGWLRNDLPIHHPDFGKLIQCPQVNMAEVMGGHSGLSLHERSLSWDSVWDLENVGRAVDAIKKTINRGYGWVFLYGGYGNAKTLLLKVAVAIYLNTRGKAVYVRMLDIIDNITDAYADHEPAAARVEFWSNIPLLAIDEIEKIKSTEYAERRRFVLLDKRYENSLRKNSITLFASNQSPDQLPGELADRLLDGRFDVVHLTGDSVRPAMRWEDNQEELF